MVMTISQIRELEKKAEVQSLRHEELMLEMSSLKKQNKYKTSQDGSPEGTITPGNRWLSWLKLALINTD